MCHVPTAPGTALRGAPAVWPGRGGRGPIAFGSVEGKNQALVDVSSRNLHQTSGEDTGAGDSGGEDSGTDDSGTDDSGTEDTGTVDTGAIVTGPRE